MFWITKTQYFKAIHPFDVFKIMHTIQVFLLNIEAIFSQEFVSYSKINFKNR